MTHVYVVDRRTAAGIASLSEQTYQRGEIYSEGCNANA
jgi:hypothetical protein